MNNKHVSDAAYCEGVFEVSERYHFSLYRKRPNAEAKIIGAGEIDDVIDQFSALSGAQQKQCFIKQGTVIWDVAEIEALRQRRWSEKVAAVHPKQNP